MIQCCKKSIDGGCAIWFAGDVNFDMNNKHGIMDPETILDYYLALNLDVLRRGNVFNIMTPNPTMPW